MRCDDEAIIDLARSTNELLKFGENEVPDDVVDAFGTFVAVKENSIDGQASETAYGH